MTELVAAMREAGASGFVDKVEPVDVILATIRAPGQGCRFTLTVPLHPAPSPSP